MGHFGSYDCITPTCDYQSVVLVIGPGTLSERELRECAECGALTTVLTVRSGSHGPEKASGRGRCAECGSQRRRVPATGRELPDDPPCPRCASPLEWRPGGMWD